MHTCCMKFETIIATISYPKGFVEMFDFSRLLQGDQFQMMTNLLTKVKGKLLKWISQLSNPNQYNLAYKGNIWTHNVIEFISATDSRKTPQ